ncbi:multifunctional cyclase-dehydratase-3-O-methyl transferase TcmN [Anaerotignum neopropionicum]|uniref:Multifunctional cyclase-dehydratase-3-O-methyl transferase TcmN n=1 Tax=Anaerotignum neopropionicum TaxID=36847 RepID=A0A136WCM1_9FIRM|nr:methyltransferase [Anaerotignum neopropionicum]KXL52196.1 multifunctional cyclase-dehydratase-3-O-methyl transferase TcmN [Anaerotignum neopropionicum]
MYQSKGNQKLYYKMLHQKRETELLLSALKLKLFSYLENWETPKAVATKSDLNERNLSFVLNALASIGLLEKNNEAYRNTQQSNDFLNPNSSVYLGESILFREKMMSLQNIEERLINGPNKNVLHNNQGIEVYDFYEAARVSIPEMYTGRVQSLIQAVTSLYGNKTPEKILDMGGGSGILAIELAITFPNCKSVVFEHPNVARLPRELVSERNLSEHVSVIEGDFNADDIGKGYDLIIASGVLDFAKDHLDSVMSKLYNALTSNGYLYVVTHNVSEDYQNPPESILGWLSSHLDGLDVLLTKKDIENALTNHGFQQMHSDDAGGVFEGLQGEFYLKKTRGSQDGKATETCD